MKVHGIIDKIQFLHKLFLNRSFYGGRRNFLSRSGSFFLTSRRINTSLLTDFTIVTVNVCNQFRGSFADRFKACTKLCQSLILRPPSNIAEAVLAGFNAVVSAYGIGNAFGFHFFGVSALLDSFRVDFLIKSLDCLVAAEVDEAVIQLGKTVYQFNGF